MQDPESLVIITTLDPFLDQLRERFALSRDPRPTGMLLHLLLKDLDVGFIPGLDLFEFRCLGKFQIPKTFVLGLLQGFDLHGKGALKSLDRGLLRRNELCMFPGKQAFAQVSFVHPDRLHFLFIERLSFFEPAVDLCQARIHGGHRTTHHTGKPRHSRHHRVYAITVEDPEKQAGKYGKNEKGKAVWGVP